MLKRQSSLLSLSFLLCALTVACGDDKKNADGDTDGRDTEEPAADGGPDSEDMCDPKGANPTMGTLLNAPVEADVEVIVKEPKHPGKPGPLNLP